MDIRTVLTVRNFDRPLLPKRFHLEEMRVKSLYVPPTGVENPTRPLFVPAHVHRLGYPQRTLDAGHNDAVKPHRRGNPRRPIDQLAHGRQLLEPIDRIPSGIDSINHPNMIEECIRLVIQFVQLLNRG